MKQTLHKLLCMLLVLTMLCSLVPAVFADEPVDPNSGEHTHTWGDWVSKGDGTHTRACTDKTCGKTQTANCNGAPMSIGNSQHQHKCADCNAFYGTPENCSGKPVSIGNGQHQHKCTTCSEFYDAPEACVDVKGEIEGTPDGLCDVCGANMQPAAQTEIVQLGKFLAAVDMVTVGTDINDILGDIANTIKGYTSDNTEVECTIEWNTSEYDSTKVGTYTLYGTIKAPRGYTLASNLNTRLSHTVKVVGDYSLTLSAGGREVTVGSALNVTATIEKKTSGPDEANMKVVWSFYTQGIDNKIATLSGDGKIAGNRSTASFAAVSCGTNTNYKNVVIEAELMSGDVLLASEVLTIKIVPATASIIKVNAASGGVTFGENAFYSALGYGLGNKLGYVSFELPSASKGTLYSDNSRYRTALPRGNKCYYDPFYTSNVIDLDTVYFEVAETYTTSPITLTYTAYNSDNNVIANGSIEVSLLTSTIRYDVDADGKVMFDEDDFRSVLRASYSGATLDYVQFDMSNAVFGNAYGGSGKYGYLYIDSSLQTKLTASNDSAKFVYNYTSSSSRYYYDLDDVTYVAGSATGKYTVTVPFTAYGTGSYQYVTGVVEIVVDETDAFTIGCTGTDFRAVTQEIANTYKNATYIMFDLPEQGTLYYDFDAINHYGHKVRSSYAYYLEPGTKDEYDLEDVWFVPAAGQTKARISFDVYSGKTKIDSGSITFSIKSRTSSQVFTDVTYANTGSWSADSVDFMYANGLIYGTGKNKFSPNATMTRGDLVLILYRLAGEPSVSGVKNPFKDVTSGDYYYKAVLWAYKNDVVNGTGNGTFSPKMAVTREQLAAILYRYSGSPSTSTRLSGFTDASKVSSYATNAMKWAVGAGIINGNGNKLDPQSSATRAQVAAMLHRYLTK